MSPTFGRFERRRAPFQDQGLKRTILRERWLLRLFEYAVLAVIVAVLWGTFLHRTGAVRAEAERLAMEGIVDELRTALYLTAVRAGGGLIEKPADLKPGGNPMNLLDRPPDNYLGELNHPDPKQIPKGDWYYDRQEESLVYRVAHTDRFHSRLPGTPRVRFRVKRFAPGIAPRGILPGRAASRVEYALLPLEPYHWNR